MPQPPFHNIFLTDVHFVNAAHGIKCLASFLLYLNNTSTSKKKIAIKIGNISADFMKRKR